MNGSTAQRSTARMQATKATTGFTGDLLTNVDVRRRLIEAYDTSMSLPFADRLSDKALRLFLSGRNSMQYLFRGLP